MDTKWIIKRSTDLVNFTEIYNCDGPTASSNPIAGVSAVVNAGKIKVTDENPPVPRAFYKFQAQKYGDLRAYRIAWQLAWSPLQPYLAKRFQDGMARS